MIESFYHRPFPTLSLDDDYLLREQSLEDTENFYRYYSRPEVGKYILAARPINTFEAESEIYYCRNLFRTQKGIYWTIARKDTNAMIGAIGLYINNFHHRGEVSYDLAPEYWRQGIMAKALKTVTQFALNDIGLDRVEAVTVPANVASINLLVKCGYHHEGCLKNYKHFNERPHDVEMFAYVK